MRCAHIVGGVVVNVVLADPSTFNYGDGSLIIASETAQIGDTYASGAFTAAKQSPPTPPAVPETVALWQAKAALRAAGLLTGADAAIAALADPVLSGFWASAATISRASPTLAKLAASLNLTSAQVDALFVSAAAIAL